MNIATLSDQLLAWFKNQGTELLSAGKAQQTPGQFKSGEQYIGKVLEALPNARSLVQVGQTKLDMALPKDVRPGDSVRLVFMTSGPRPTFQLAQNPIQSIQPVRLSDTSQQVNALVRFAQASNLPAASTPSASLPTAASAAQVTAGKNAAAVQSLAQQVAGTGQTAVSQAAARPIVANAAVFFTNAAAPPTTSAMIGGAANPAMAMSGQAIDSARPTLASNPSLMSQGIIKEEPMNANVLPMRLRQVLSESGMFYESHLGRWTQGRIPMESILREPQARLADMPGRLLTLQGLDGMPEEAARLAGRQLQMLEGGAFFWQGYAWANQWMDWVVQEDVSASGKEDQADKWLTELRLNMPRLGDVAAKLAIGSQGLRIQLSTGQELTLAEMKAALPELAGRLKAAELNVIQLDAGLADGER